MSEGTFTLTTEYVSVSRAATGSVHRTIASLLASDHSITHVYCVFGDVDAGTFDAIQSAVTADTARVIRITTTSDVAADIDENIAKVRKSATKFATKTRMNTNNRLVSRDVPRAVHATGYFRDNGSNVVGLTVVAGKVR